MNMPSYLSELRRHMDAVADRHDMQQLADPAVAALSQDEIQGVFAGLLADWNEARRHAGVELADSRTTCPIDEEVLPCSILRAIAAKYGVEKA